MKATKTITIVSEYAFYLVRKHLDMIKWDRIGYDHIRWDGMGWDGHRIA